MKRIKQTDIANELGIAASFFCHIINGQRRPSPQKAIELEKKSGIERMIWLYGKHHDLRRELEKKYGKIINFSKGRPRKSE